MIFYWFRHEITSEISLRLTFPKPKVFVGVLTCKEVRVVLTTDFLQKSQQKDGNKIKITLFCVMKKGLEINLRSPIKIIRRNARSHK